VLSENPCQIKTTKWGLESNGLVLRIGNRSSSNYYRLYQKQNGLQFELELKNQLVKSFQKLLTDNSIQEFEHNLSKHFYRQSFESLNLNSYYMDWLLDWYRKASHNQNTIGLLTTYLKNDNKELTFNFLRFLSFLQSQTKKSYTRSFNPKFLEFQKNYYPKSLPQRFNTNQCPSSKFKQLAYDPIYKDYRIISIDEARAVVQAELQNLVIEPTRPNEFEAKLVDLDLKVEGPDPWTHVDIKQPVGSEALRKQNQTISVEEMAYRIGKKIVKQKHYFVGLETGPLSSENVGHIVDLCYVPSSEKAIVKQNVLQGAADSGSDTGIVFLNY
jgi:hypothetical protein